MKNGYKRFHDLTIDLGENPKRIVALVGPNGCGKSSVLDGLLYHTTAYAGIGGGSHRGSDYHSMHGLSTFGQDNIEIEFTRGTYRQAWERKKPEGKDNTIFSFRSPYRYNSNLKVKETRATTELRRNKYGASSASDLDDKMEENYRRLYVKLNRYMQDNDCKPSEAREKIIGDLNASITKCLGLEIESIGNIEASQGTLFFRKKDHPKSFEFNVLSSGEKEVVDILLDLYLRAEDYDDTVFLLDEPELHINTAIQRSLLEEIDRLVGENCQIWITTHSIGFLRLIQGEMRDKCQVIQFRADQELASRPYTLTPMTSSRANWRDIFSIALDDLASLVSPTQIVYCEGRAAPGSKGSENGLDAQVFNTIFSHSYPDTLFVSSGGNTELDQRSAIAIAILGKVYEKLEILVLKDRDMASGQPVSEDERKRYLSTNDASHRVLRRWEIENYLYDKEVLQAYCNTQGLTFDEANYDAFVTDIDNQNLKDSTGRIKSICGIATSVNADIFKRELAECIAEEMTVYKELEACIFKRQ